MLTATTAALAQDLATGVQIGTYEWRPEVDQVIWSAELMRIYGVQQAPRSENEFGALIHPEDRLRVEAETASYLSSDLASYSHSFRILRPDGSVRVILDRAAIDRDDAGRVVLMRGVNIDVTEESHLLYTVDDRLRASEQRYRKLFEAIDSGFCVVEVRLDAAGEGTDTRTDYRVVEANPAFFASTGFPPAIMGAWLRKAAPGLEEHWFESYGGVARTGRPIRFENHSEFLGRWFDVYAFPFEDPGDPRVAILFTDISERKRQEERTQLLVDEVNHRSKNTLGMVLAIARLSADSGGPGFLDRFGARLRALSASHDLLVRDQWRRVDLANLIQTQLSPFVDRTGQRVKLDGPPLELNDLATKALGMAFHELASNAAKYGALSNDAGHIAVSWTVEDDGTARPQMKLVWLEKDGPPVAAPTRKGFGTTVTTQMVESDTNGTVGIDYAPEGLAWRVSCPTHEVLA